MCFFMTMEITWLFEKLRETFFWHPSPCTGGAKFVIFFLPLMEYVHFLPGPTPI